MLFLKKQRFHGSFVEFPDLTSKAWIIGVVELFMLDHPIPKLFIFQFTEFCTDSIVFENIHGEFPHQVVHVGCGNLYISWSHFDPENCASWFVLCLQILQQIWLYFTGNSIRGVKITFVNFESGEIGLLEGIVVRANAVQSSALVNTVDCH